MRKLLFIPIFFTILLSSAGELPWKSSTLWNQDSQPLPLTGKVRRLEKCGAVIRDQRPLDAVTERDVVTNYHVRQILTLRRELIQALEK